MLWLLPEAPTLWSYARLVGNMKPGDYRLSDGAASESVVLGWGLSTYRYDVYRAKPRAHQPVLCLAEGESGKGRIAYGAVHWVRDLINAPAEDMGPDALAEAMEKLAESHGAHCYQVMGDALLEVSSIARVGRASDRAPRLLAMRWGEQRLKLTWLVKGCHLIRAA